MAYYTVQKADMFSTELNIVLFTVESSSSGTVCIVEETEKLKIKNDVNSVEHATLEAAKEYKELRSNAEHERISLEKEQGI